MDAHTSASHKGIRFELAPQAASAAPANPIVCWRKEGGPLLLFVRGCLHHRHFLECASRKCFRWSSSSAAADRTSFGQVNNNRDSRPVIDMCERGECYYFISLPGRCSLLWAGGSSRQEHLFTGWSRLNQREPAAAKNKARVLFCRPKRRRQNINHKKEPLHSRS